MELIREGLFEITQNGSGYLLTNKCERCGMSFFPRRERCRICWNDDPLKDTTLSTGAQLYTYTTVYRASPYFNVPLMVGYVDFEEEGIRVFAQLTGCESKDLEIGMEMELVFEEMDIKEKEKRKLVYKFKPIKGK
jgi:uncharacterized OB-fold protein